MQDSGRFDLERLKNYEVAYRPPLEASNRSNQLRNCQYQQSVQMAARTKPLVDTPSTSYGVTRSNQRINSVVRNQIQNIVHKQIEEMVGVESKRSNGIILSVQQIKQSESKIKERALSRASVQSEGRQKIFVSIAKTHRANSEHRRSEQVLMSPEPSGKNKIKLTKYMQFKSNEKSNKK